MRKIPTVKVNLASLLHKGVVSACAAITLGGVLYSTGLVRHHYAVVIPEREKKESSSGNTPELQDPAKALEA